MKKAFNLSCVMVMVVMFFRSSKSRSIGIRHDTDSGAGSTT